MIMLLMDMIIVIISFFMIMVMKMTKKYAHNMTLMSRYKGHYGDARKKTFFQIKNDLNGSNDIREMILCSGCQQLPK